MVQATVSQSTLSKRAALARETYSTAEVAAKLGVSYTTVNESIRAGTFPVAPIRVGRQYLFPRKLVDRLLGDDAA